MVRKTTESSLNFRGPLCRGMGDHFAAEQGGQLNAELGDQFARILQTVETQQYLKDQLQLSFLPDFKIRKKTSENLDISVLDNPIKKYFKKTTTEQNIPITTIHQVKGMTFDSVLLVLSEDSKGQNISLKDIKEPDNLPSEKQRLIYVAMSRPSKLLCIGVPDTTADDDLKLKFGKDIVIL